MHLRIGHPCRGESCRPAFTIVELLVVVTVIMVLVTLLLPAVNRTSEIMKMYRCQNNMKQLLHGFLSYAADNNTYFPFPAVNECSEDWIYWQSDRNFQAGGIAPYLGNPVDKNLYICPSDDPTAHPLGYPYSYSANINITGWWPSGDHGTPDVPSVALLNCHHTSTLILFIEESAFTIDDGCWAWQAEWGETVNMLTARHDQKNNELTYEADDPNIVQDPWAGRGNCAYVDGHVAFTLRGDAYKAEYYNPN